MKVLLSITLLVACGEPVREYRETPREMPHVPEVVQPAIEAAEARAATGEMVARVGSVSTLETASPEERAETERAALDQLSMAAQLPAPPGRVHLLAPTDVRGRLNPESLRSVMDPALESLERCYTDVLRADRHAVGRVTAQWTITGGRVTEVTVVPGAVSNPALHECLSDWLRELRVPSSGTVVLTQPFLFHHAS